MHGDHGMMEKDGKAVCIATRSKKPLVVPGIASSRQLSSFLLLVLVAMASNLIAMASP